MTTLHGLVTMSELFADFNFINTGVVNCLIMCHNARKNAQYSEAKKIQKSSGKPCWGADILHPNLTHRACGASTLAT